MIASAPGLAAESIAGRDLMQIAGIAADDACSRKLPDQVLVQFLVQLQNQQVGRGNPVVQQRLR